MTARKMIALPFAVFAFVLDYLGGKLMDFAMWIDGDDQ